MPMPTVTVQRQQSSADSDTGTAQTVERMCEHIRESSSDPLVQQISRQAVEGIRGGPQWIGIDVAMRDPFSSSQLIGESCWWYAKHRMKFVPHAEQIWKWLGEKDQLQLLISPDVLVRMQRPEGDCAIYTMLVCAMLTALNQPWEIVTIKCNPKAPNLYTHVFPRLVLPNGRREALDASHGKFPGWQVPAEHTFATQVWDSNGDPIPDMAPQFDGLHDYVAARRGMWGYPGLGDDLTDLSTIAIDPTLGTNLTYLDQWNTLAAGTQSPSAFETITPADIAGDGFTLTTPLSPSVPAGSLVAPSQNSAAWAAFAAQLAKAGMSLATINAVQPGTIVNPNGQIIRQATGYPVGSTSGSFAVGSLGSPTLIWGAVILGAVLLMGRR